MICISISGDANLDVSDVWPDGDAPKNPTAADVCELIQRLYHSEETFLREWELLRGLEIDVYVNGESANVFGSRARAGR